MSLISLKTDSAEENLLFVNKQIEIFFHKLLGLQFIETDDDFINFWKHSVSVVAFIR